MVLVVVVMVQAGGRVDGWRRQQITMTSEPPPRVAGLSPLPLPLPTLLLPSSRDITSSVAPRYLRLSGRRAGARREERKAGEKGKQEGREGR